MIVFEPQPEPVIHRVDPRVRLLATLAFAALVCVAARFDALLVALAFSLLLLLLARAADARSLRKLAAVNLFVLLLAVLLPLSVPGAAAFALGPFRWSADGLRHAGLIALRANAILCMSLALVGTTDPARLGVALHGLGLPAKLVQLFFFTVRYIEIFHHEYHRLRDAMRLRAFRPRSDRRTLRVFGHLLGILLVRSVDRAERVLAAAKCRGFRGRFYALDPLGLGSRDLVFSLFAAAAAALVAWMAFA